MVRVPCKIFLGLLTGAVGARIDFDVSAGNPIYGEFGTYSRGKLLGSGAYGKVYLATEESSGEELVAKIIDLQGSPEAEQSFVTEGFVWSHMVSCDGYPHPNVIQYHEVMKLGPREGVVIMEKASGGSLSSLLYKGVSADGADTGTRTGAGDEMLENEAEAMKLFGQIAAGAQWLATCGVIHKDLKPDNIMLSKAWTAGGVAKIIDFGLAAVLSAKDSGALANMYYNLVQTVDIRSKPLEASTFDNFALGLLLAELGTGVPPYFNPNFDYSSKRGNLQNEKGVLYIKAKAADCRRGDKGLYERMKELADSSKSELRSVVGEVAGRSLHVIKTGTHFLYASAHELGIESKWMEESWLYNSPAAMDLLFQLLRRDATQRMNPTELLHSDWLSGSTQTSFEPQATLGALGGFESHSRGAGGFGAPTLGGFESHRSGMGGFGGQDRGDFDTGKPSDAFVTEPVDSSPVDTSKPLCPNARKEMGPPTVCKIRFTGSSQSCFVKVKCNRGQVELKEIFSGIGGNEVQNCRNCELLAG